MFHLFRTTLTSSLIYFPCNILGGTGSGSSADSACVADDIECLENVHDRLGMEAIKSLHQQLDDDDNGNIDLTESDDVSIRFSINSK